MTTDQRIGVAAISTACPGFAQAVTGHRIAAAVWATLGLVPCLLGVLGIAMLALVGLVRLAAPIPAYVTARRHADAPRWGGLLPTAVILLGVVGYAVLGFSVATFKVPTPSMLPAIDIDKRVLVDELTLHWRAPERGEVILFDYPCDPNRKYVKRVIALAGDSVEVRCDIVYVNDVALATELVTARDSYRDRDASGGDWHVRACSRYRERQGSRSYETFHAPERPERDRSGGTPDHADFPDRDLMLVPSCQHGEFFDKPNLQPTGTIIALARNTPAKPCEPQLHYIVPPGAVFVMGDNRNNASDSRFWGAVPLSAVTGRLIDVL